MRKKIMLVFGTRPEAVKMAPLVKELEKYPERFETVVVITAQHREMLDQVLTTFDIRPDYDLDLMEKNQGLADITTKVLIGVQAIIQTVKPDMVLVHGDTTTGFASSLAAFYEQIPIGHVEAGLRTYQKYSPFPEEMNRTLISRLADLHFAPTKLAEQALWKENISKETVFVTGNTAIDALKFTTKTNNPNQFIEKLREHSILLTTHRRENLGKGMDLIFESICRIANEYPTVDIVYPVHLNPKIREKAYQSFRNFENVHVIEPLDVVAFHHLLAKVTLILTDSGGIQEEAPSLGKPVLVLRDTTERPEGIDAGTLKLVGTDPEAIYQNVKMLLEDNEEYQKMSHAKNPFGNGTASKQIVAIINRFFYD